MKFPGKVTELPLPVARLVAVEGGSNGKESLLYIQSRFTRKGGKVEGGMYVSKDWGKHWAQVNKGILDGVMKNEVPIIAAGTGCM